MLESAQIYFPPLEAVALIRVRVNSGPRSRGTYPRDARHERTRSRDARTRVRMRWHELADRGSFDAHAARAELMLQIMMGNVIGALGEMHGLSQRAGLDSDAILEMLSHSAMGSALTTAKGKLMSSKNFAPNFQVYLQQKDLRLALNLADELDYAAPITRRRPTRNTSKPRGSDTPTAISPPSPPRTRTKRRNERPLVRAFHSHARSRASSRVLHLSISSFAAVPRAASLSPSSCFASARTSRDRATGRA